MATAIIAGIASYGAASGAGGLLAEYALALGVASAGATYYAETQAAGDVQQVAPTPIDKSTFQQQAEVGELQLGESAEDKQKRKKGKSAFKIDLPDTTTADTGVQAPAATEVGVQL